MLLIYLFLLLYFPIPIPVHLQHHIETSVSNGQSKLPIYFYLMPDKTIILSKFLSIHLAKALSYTLSV